MNYSEIFGELGQQVEQIVKEKGLNLIVDNKEKPEYIPKNRFDEVIGSKNELKTQVSELAGQLEELKKTAKGNDDLVKQIGELQARNQDWESRYKSSIIESNVKLKASLEKANDPNDLIKFLDTSKFELNETGEILGLDEQIGELKKQKPYLFGISQHQNTPINPTGTKKVSEYDELMSQLKQRPGDSSLMQKLFLLKERK